MTGVDVIALIMLGLLATLWIGVEYKAVLAKMRDDRDG